MTWWSECSAVPRFVLAKLAIRCRFVDRFVGSRVPSRVSGQRFSAHGTFLPSVGSRRARFPVFIGVGSEEAPIEGRASVRRSNGTCSFPAFRFHEWLREIRREGINETRLTSLHSPNTRLGRYFL